MRGPIFPRGDEFKRLWAKIPGVVTYEDYVSLCNEIDSCNMDRLITPCDEAFLLKCLEICADVKRIKKLYL